MSGLVLRLAEDREWDAVCDVWRRATEARTGHPAPPPRDVPGRFAVVADDGGPVAIAVGIPAREEGGAGRVIPALAFLSAVAVVPERWGEGIGGAVVEHWQDQAWAREYERALLYTGADNPRAQSLYERLGWTRSGVEMLNDFGMPIVQYVRDL